MYVFPPPKPDGFQRLSVPAGRRRRVLRAMLVGSLVLHLLALVGVWLLRPAPPETEGPTSDEVALVFENQAGAKQASTEAAQPSPAPSVAVGNPDAPVAPPEPETVMASSSPVPSDAPPAPLTEAMVSAQPPTEVLLPDPTVPLPQPVPTPPQVPATVSLYEGDEPAYRPPLPFVLPQPPLVLPPLPPLPRPVPLRPRAFAQPRSASPFAAPQDWSFNAGPSQRQPGHASRGFDMAPAQQSGQSDSSFSYVAGARPTGDWLGAFRRWAQARVYYPEEAARQGQDGVATVMLEIERSGHVHSVHLVSSARSPFLDGALVDIFRNANVPPVTSDMPDATTMMRVQLTYHLIRR